ncbi:hypothetical protein [Streptomyces sp. cmx-4-7]|uniref:hypothetical protein n=1 Tax=Streptomyces sp. cmx-4-7 TaxID=2790939 RepID=UPI00397EFA99
MQTARDTRAALERDWEQQKAVQAWQVTYWEEETGFDLKEGEPRLVYLHVINRSLDPVPRWSLTYWGPQAGAPDGKSVRMAFSALPPCTEVIINSPLVFGELDWDHQPSGKAQATFQEFTFTDTRGNSWNRELEGGMASVSEFGTRTYFDLHKTLKDSKSKMRPAEDCGAVGGS